MTGYSENNGSLRINVKRRFLGIYCLFTRRRKEHRESFRPVASSRKIVLSDITLIRDDSTIFPLPLHNVVSCSEIPEMSQQPGQIARDAAAVTLAFGSMGHQYPQVRSDQVRNAVESDHVFNIRR